MTTSQERGSSQSKGVELRLTLTAEQAAALKWVAEKFTHDDCMQHTYAHRPKEERVERAYEMLDAFREVEKALGSVRSWPWIETGSVR